MLCQRQEDLRGGMELVCKAGGAVQKTRLDGNVVQLHEGIAHGLVGLLQLLDSLVQGLDRILLAVAICPLGQADLGPPTLHAGC